MTATSDDTNLENNKTPESSEAAAKPEVPTKERLLRIALKLLNEEGISAMTIRNIAERGGVSVSVVHHHYVNKQGLLDACKMNFYSELGKVIVDVLPTVAGQPIGVVLDLAVRRFWAHARENVRVLRLLSSQVLATGQLIDRIGDYDNRPFLALGIRQLAPLVGLEEDILRVRLQSMIILLSRFAVSSDAELSSIVGKEPEAAAEAIENHLVDIAKLLLLEKKPSNSEPT